MSLFGWSLPPGVRVSDIPGNRPEDLAAEDMAEAEAEFYRRVLRHYGRLSKVAKEFRNAFLTADAENEMWLDDEDSDAEAEEIEARMGDNDHAMHEARYDGGEDRDGLVTEVPEADWPQWAKDAKAENERLLAHLNAMCHGDGGEGEQPYQHRTWCPIRRALDREAWQREAAERRAAESALSDKMVEQQDLADFARDDTDDVPEWVNDPMEGDHAEEPPEPEPDYEKDYPEASDGE